MVDTTPVAKSGDKSVESSGYQQELKRTLGSFQVFAISFAFISVAVGIFGTYDDLLTNGGPVAIWHWIVVAIGQTLIALVIAQFAARIPLSGSSYQWASRLANPKIGWGFGWLTFCYLVLGVAAVDFALVSQALMPLLGLESVESTARMITIVVMLVQAVLAIASTRIVSWINSAAVGVELTLIVVVTLALVIAVLVSSSGDVSNLTSRGVTVNDPDYFSIGGGLMLAMIMGLGTLVGFDAAANLAEEAKDPYRTVPRAIVGSVVAAGVLGLVFLIALTVAITDIPRISASASPVAAIMSDQLGPAMEKSLLLVITFAFFGAGLVTLTSGARTCFAMSRDKRFPAHQVMRRIHPRLQTPIPATILIVVLGILLMIALPGDALIELITAGTILPAVIYGSTVILYLAVRGRLERKKGGFDLGRFELPVAIGALIWSMFALFVLVAPGGSGVSVLIVVGLLVVGGLYFGYMLIFDRDALTTEPGEVGGSVH